MRTILTLSRIIRGTNTNIIIRTFSASNILNDDRICVICMDGVSYNGVIGHYNDMIVIDRNIIKRIWLTPLKRKVIVNKLDLCQRRWIKDSYYNTKKIQQRFQKYYTYYLLLIAL